MKNAKETIIHPEEWIDEGWGGLTWEPRFGPWPRPRGDPGSEVNAVTFG